MKTKELVKRLLETDPTGEAHVCVGNIDIIDVDGPMPGYYDGQFVEIVHDKEYGDLDNCFGVTKVIARCSSVEKIKLRTMDAEEAFLDNPEAEFEQDTYNENRHKEWEKCVKEWRKEGRKLQRDFEKMRIEAEKEKAKTE